MHNLHESRRRLSSTASVHGDSVCACSLNRYSMKAERIRVKSASYGNLGHEGLGVPVPPPVDNLKLPHTFTEYTEWCYHLRDTCFERRTSRNRSKLRYSMFNIYSCFDVIFAHHYTWHSFLYIIVIIKERNVSC